MSARAIQCGVTSNNDPSNFPRVAPSGLEPERLLGRRILSPLRLPIPPRGLHGDARLPRVSFRRRSSRTWANFIQFFEGLCVQPEVQYAKGGIQLLQGPRANDG